jgi:hypothetical protein
MSTETFTYDVFLSHCAKDKAAVRDVVERSRKDGLQTVSQPSTLNHPLASAPPATPRREIDYRVKEASLPYRVKRK